MKIININESQKKRLFEAYDGRFSFKKLDMHPDLNAMVIYCDEHLGESFATGSSRCVYMLSDNFVLKLAYNAAGIEQNKLEFERYDKTKSKLFPIVYDHGKNFEYIVCENVVPANDVDFEKILDIPYEGSWKQYSVPEKNSSDEYNGDYEIGYNKYFDNIKYEDDGWDEPTASDIIAYLERKFVYKTDEHDEYCDNIINRIPWFKELEKLIKNEQICDLDVISNFGIVNRDGKPFIVIIDSGFSVEVYNKYYTY